MAYRKEKVICGIYTITHAPTGRIYVGSSVHIYKRWTDHLAKLRHGSHENEYLQAAWSKYGESEFVFEIVATATREDAHDIERLWMAETNCLDRSKGFNINSDPQTRTGRPLSDTHKAKLSEALRGRFFSKEHRRKLSEASKGKPKAPHAIAAATAAKIGKPLSDEHKAKVSLASKGTSNGNSKITESDVRAIKRLLDEKVSAPKIAKLFPIATSQIYRIAKGESWAHVSYQPTLGLSPEQ